MSLTPKQSLFVAEYLVDLNATKAAIRAGYAVKRADAMGHENLRKPEISKAIEAAMNERAKRIKRTADDVLSDILAVKNDAVQIVSDRDGNQVMADRGAALKALELEGKHYKMFTDKLEHSGEVKTPELRLILNGVRTSPATN